MVGSTRERKALATRTGRRQLLRLRPTASLRPTAVWRKDGASFAEFLLSPGHFASGFLSVLRHVQLARPSK